VKRQPGDPVYDALEIKRQVKARRDWHRLGCYRCGGGKVAAAACTEGVALDADLADAERIVKLRREQEKWQAAGQGELFSADEVQR